MDKEMLTEKLIKNYPFDYTALLEAAKKLQHDFGLAEVSYDCQKEASVYRERQKSIRKELEFKKWKEEYAPKNFEELLHPLFVESLQEQVKIEYYCDLFLYGTDEDIKEFKEYEERLVKRIADRIRDCRQSDLGRTNPNLGNER